MRLEDEKQFELAKTLHTRSPLALEQICFNFLEMTWSSWVSACNIQQKNLFNNIRKYSNCVLNLKLGTVLDFEGSKTYTLIPHKAWF